MSEPTPAPTWEDRLRAEMQEASSYDGELAWQGAARIAIARIEAMGAHRPAPEPIAPGPRPVAGVAASPEMVEVPDGQQQIGDRFIITGVITETYPSGAFGFLHLGEPRVIAAEPSVAARFTRPAGPPLPKEAGAVGTAVLLRHGRVRVHLLDPGAVLSWLAYVDGAPSWFSESHLADYVRELDGSDL